MVASAHGQLRPCAAIANNGRRQRAPASVTTPDAIATAYTVSLPQMPTPNLELANDR